MDEIVITHSKAYDLLKNRMTNGTEFYKVRALEAIAASALDMTQDEVDELTAFATQHGVEVLDKDRLTAVEATTDELTLMMADLIGGAV